MACTTCHKVRAALLSALGRGKYSVEIRANYTHKVGRVHVQYVAGAIYRKVPEDVVRAIVAANAGHIVYD